MNVLPGAGCETATLVLCQDPEWIEHDARLSGGLMAETDFQVDTAIWGFWGYGDFED